MWTLTIEDEAGNVEQVDLERDAYTLGRADTNDVVLPEKNVSRRHARLVRDANGRWQLYDLESAYGCFVNGLRVVGSAPLAPTDAIQLGDFRLALRADQPGAAITRPMEVPLPSLAPELRELPDRLRFLGGPAHGHELRLDRGPLSFGHDDDCSVRLRTPDPRGPIRLLVRPLPHGRYEVLDQSDPPRLAFNGQLLARTLLDERDLLEAGESLRLRFLPRQRLFGHEAVTPVPLRPLPTEPDLSLAVHQGRVLGLGTLPTLAPPPGHEETPKGPTLRGLNAPSELPPPASQSTPQPPDPDLLATVPPPVDGHDTEPGTPALVAKSRTPAAAPPPPEPPSREVPSSEPPSSEPPYADVPLAVPRKVAEPVLAGRLGTGGAEMPLPAELPPPGRRGGKLFAAALLAGVLGGALWLWGQTTSSRGDDVQREPARTGATTLPEAGAPVVTLAPSITPSAAPLPSVSKGEPAAPRAPLTSTPPISRPLPPVSRPKPEPALTSPVEPEITEAERARQRQLLCQQQGKCL